MKKNVLLKGGLDQLQETHMKYSAGSSLIFYHDVQELLPFHLRDENQDGTADGDENAASTEASSS